MKNRFIITITDINGSKQYNIHQFAKQFLLYFILFVVVVICVCFIAIHLLLKEVDIIGQRREKIYSEYLRIVEQNDNLQALIDEKSNELVRVADRIEDLEGIVGINTKRLDENLSLVERVNLANVTGAQKAFVYQLVPSGHPLKGNPRVTAEWGTRTHPILRRTHLHTGMDFGVPVGTPVYATADGVADINGVGYNGGYGTMLKLEHAYGFKTFYAHLSRIVVQNGDFVKKGQLIALTGNTGRSTGPHLHYEVRFLGNDLDPRPFVEWTMGNYAEIFEKEKKIKWQSLLTTIRRLSELQGIQQSSRKGLQ